MVILFESEPVELLNHKNSIYLLHTLKGDHYNSPSEQKYRNKSGEALSGFYARLSRNNIEVMKIYGGRLFLKYRFPKPDNFFAHEMISWENLLFTIGGARTTEVKQVIARKKPMGFYTANKSNISSTIRLLKKNNIPHAMGKKWINGPYELFEVGCCVNGKIGETFDLEEIAYFYEQLFSHDGLSIELIKEREEKRSIKERLLELGDYKFTDFLSGWDYANPSGIFELIKTGLLLGYPIESTYACITGKVY